MNKIHWQFAASEATPAQNSSTDFPNSDLRANSDPQWA